MQLAWVSGIIGRGKARLGAWLAEPTHWCLVLVGLFMLAVALVGPIERKGDSSEYILTTESLYYDHDLIFDPAVDVRRNAMMRPEGLLDIPGGLAGMNGTDGKTRYGLHSFYYSLAVIPFYALLGYRAFLVFNAICV